MNEHVKKMISILLFCARSFVVSVSSLSLPAGVCFLEERGYPYHNVSALKDHFEVCVVEGKWSEVKNRKEQKQKHKKTLYVIRSYGERERGGRSSHV